MKVLSWSSKGRRMRATWVWPALTLLALAAPAVAADRVVLAEEFTSNS
jgi:hypothetical protein